MAKIEGKFKVGDREFVWHEDDRGWIVTSSADGEPMMATWWAKHYEEWQARCADARNEAERAKGRMPGRTISVDLPTFKELLELHDKAISEDREGDTVLKYKDSELLLSYLHYLLEYMIISNPEIKEYAETHGVSLKRPRKEVKG